MEEFFLILYIYPQWHPTRSVIASVMLYGRICLWVANHQENWSAFAPDFKELEENVDYEEREDEFDEVPQAVAHKKRSQGDESVVVDVASIDPSNEDPFFLPIIYKEGEEEEEEEVPQSPTFVPPQQFTIGEKKKTAATDDRDGKRAPKRSKPSGDSRGDKSGLGREKQAKLASPHQPAHLTTAEDDEQPTPERE